VGWLGRGARSPVRKVLLAEATTKETYGRAFGFERSMDSAGAIVGPLLAVGLVATWGPRTTFALTVVPAVIAALLVGLLVQEKPHELGARSHLFDGVRQLPRSFRRFLFGVGMAGLGDFSNTLLIMFATQAWTPRLGAATAATQAIGFYAGYNVVYTFSCSIAGRLADRYPKQRVLAFGYAAAVVPALALLAPGASLLKFAVIFGCSGLYMGFWETVESTSAAAYLPATVRGTGFGLLDTVNGVGDFVSSIVVGVLWTLRPAAAMGFVIATTLVGAVVVWTMPAPGEDGRR
jgi:MFS family permease